MTFEELDAKYANGFDDAKILGVTLDYQNRAATLHLSLRGNLPESPDRDAYEQATLTVREFYYFSIEPPDSDHLSYPKRGKISVDGLSEDPSKFPLFEKLKPTLSPGAFCCRFFVHDWNSFIHVAAKDADFSWTPTGIKP